MKNLLYFLILILFVSCDDDYLDVLPKGQAIPENTDQLAQMLNDTESINRQGSIQGLMTDQGELPIFFQDEDQIRRMTWGDYPFSEIQDDLHWNRLYQAISVANYVLENIDNLENGDIYDVSETKARAHFIRANSYFNLVFSYAKNWSEDALKELGVPLTLTFDLTNQLERASIGEVYEQIFSDLQNAEQNVPVTVLHRTDQSRAAVYALYGRIYLYQQKYDLASEYCKKALDDYSFLYNYNDLSVAVPGLAYAGLVGYASSRFNNEECIYAMKADDQFFMFYDDFLNKHESTDLRIPLFTTDSNILFGFPGTVASNFGDSFDASLTTPELILNYCEALLKQTQPNELIALQYLSMLQSNRYETGTVIDNSNLLDQLMLERELELRHSALRFYDMKRFGVMASKTFNGETYTIKDDSPNYVLPIPPNVMKLNPKLEQNERGL